MVAKNRFNDRYVINYVFKEHRRKFMNNFKVLYSKNNIGLEINIWLFKIITKFILFENFVGNVPQLK